MKRCIISGVIGAVVMFVVLIVFANITATAKNEKIEKYEHIDFVSAIKKEDCFICGTGSDYSYWGEDNVAILNLNTFELCRIEINRYDEKGEQLLEECGCMTTGGMSDNDINVHCYMFPDNGYASVEMKGLTYSIDRKMVENNLCSDCLTAINGTWFGDFPPAECAIVNLKERTIDLLLDSRAWFASGEYGIDCEYKTNGDIDLLIHIASNRFE